MNSEDCWSRIENEYRINLNHVIRTPMNTIIGYSELALSTDLTGPQRNYLEKINTAALTLMERLRILLEYPGTGAEAPEEETILFEKDALAEDESRARRKEDPPLENSRRLKGMRVLLVEDNRINQEVARDILGQFGVRVSIAEDGEEALYRLIFQKEDFDAVLMDIQMPRMDGLEATHLLRQWEREKGLPQLPVIAVTAHTLEDDRIRCMRAGMDDFLEKPIRSIELFKALACRRKEMEAELPSEPYSTRKDSPVEMADPLSRVGGNRRRKLRPPQKSCLSDGDLI